VVWRTTKRSRLILMIAVSIAILLSAFGLPVTAYGPQNSGQSNPGGYVKYTLDLINNALINGNFVNTGNGMGPWGIAYDPSNGYIYVTNSGSGTVSVINGTTVIANITVGIGPEGVAYDPSNGYLYVTNSGSGTVSIIFTGVSTSSTTISSVTTPTTSTSTRPTSSVVPALAVVAAVVVVVLVVALLMIKRRKP